jgi:OOP family OmpA-OmpF porin
MTMNDSAFRWTAMTFPAARRRMTLAFFTISMAGAVAGLSAQPAVAAPGDQPVKPAAGAKTGDDASRSRITSLPARGLFVGDQLSPAARLKLTELIIDALGLRVEVALVVPVGPWQIDGAGHTDHDLNAARLQALRHFLSERGIDAKSIYVESRTDAKVTEPRLDVQLLGQPATD